MDDRGWPVALTPGAAAPAPAASAPRVLRRVDPDRRLAAPLVRGSWGAVYAPRLHRRCDGPAHGAAFRADGEHLGLFRRARELPGQAWPSGRLLLRQAFGLPHAQAERALQWHDPVRPRSRR